MKINTVKAISIAGLLFSSQLTQADPPTVDTFEVGQPLTAEHMNTIKALTEYNTSDTDTVKVQAGENTTNIDKVIVQAEINASNIDTVILQAGENTSNIDMVISQAEINTSNIDTVISEAELFTRSIYQELHYLYDQVRSFDMDIRENTSRIDAIQASPSTTVNTAPPTTGDDMNSPYIVGSIWVDTTGGDAYILVDNTANNAVWKSIFNNTPAVYAIGDTGPAGGIVFYITDLGIHGLEAAPTDQSTGAAWGCRDDGVITGADGTSIGTGAQNTADILAGCSETGIAAFVADEVIINNYGDWYLPSSGELASMYNAIGQGSSSLGNVGNFSHDAYWSSTENGNTNVSAKVYLFNPSAAGVADLDKATPQPVRVIRTF
jgi:hypothetical protein